VTAIFVTATGTDIGKTFVATGLIAHDRKAGRTVEAIKPVVTGFSPETRETSDPARLLAALGREASMDEIERISPWRLAAPLSPYAAAKQEGRPIDYNAVVEFSRRAMANRRGTLLIEGIGGIMVPLDDRHTVLDWMSLLRIPIILVTGSYVGTISHTLTALEVLARRNLNVAAVVVSESEGSAATLADTLAILHEFAAANDLVGIPRLAPGSLDHPAFAALAGLF
jgi:dethiobiotin synthetase